MKSMLQVRIDEDLKDQAIKVFDQLGIDISTAIRIFLKRSVAVNGIPFELRNDNSTDKAIAAINSMREASHKNGNENLTLDEINQIINEARMEKKS